MSAGNIVLTAALLPITVTLSVMPNYTLSNREMEVRAEYYTEGGKYLGGTPMYGHEFQLYECTRFNSDNIAAATDGNATTTTEGAEGNVCVSWTTHEVKSAVYDVGRCSCQSVVNADYCEAWTCSRLRVGSTRCTCGTEDAESGTFCSSWTCVITDPDGTQEFGEYQCATASTASPEFCEAWTGVTEDSTEVVASACECVEQWDAVGVCSQWECKERRLDKCSHADRLWCNFGAAVRLGCSFGSVGAITVAFAVYCVDKDYLGLCLVYIIIGLYMIAISGRPVILWGGQDGAVCVGIWWGAIIALGVLCRCRVTYVDVIMDCLTTFRDRTTKYLATNRVRTTASRDE